MSAKTDEIDAILDGYHMSALLMMARPAKSIKLSKGNPKKAELQAALRAGFFTRERVLASLACLDQQERAALDRLLLRGGSASTESLRRELVRAGLAAEASPRDGSSRVRNPAHGSGVTYARGSYIGDPHRPQSRVFEDLIARLTLRGLVFSRFDDGQGAEPVPKLQFHPADRLYIPAAVLEHLPQPQPPPEMPEPAVVRRGEPALLLRDLYLYWDYTRRNEVALTKAGLVTKRALRAINAQLLVPDPLLDDARSETETGRLALLGSLLKALDLVTVEAARLRPAGDDPLHIPEFWGWPESRQLAACLEAWPRLPALHELHNDAAPYEPQHGPARCALLSALRDEPPGRWLEPEHLLDRVQSSDADFLFGEHSRIQRSRSSWYHSYSNSHYYGSPRSLLQVLNTHEARFVESALAGALCDLGIVEVGYEGERLAAFRLTPAGHSALLGSEPGAAEPAEAGRVVLQPNFQLMAIGPVSLAVLARLDLFAERERAGRAAFQYQLSRESVYRAQQAGMEVPEIVGFLQEVGGVALPQNVRRSLEEWAAHHERIVFRSGVSLLQAATPELLRELMAGPETGPCLARSVTPEVAIVAPGRQGQLVTALVQQGLFPAVSNADAQSADHSVVVGADGTIRPIHAVPSLHLRGRLVRLAEPGAEGDGEWRLTPSSVHRAGGNRARVTRLLEELERLHRGALPEALVEQVKAWGGYYGDAAVEALTLVEFRDPAALDELRQRPELKALLTPFQAGKRALAVVPGEQLAEVREILAGLGVRLREGLT